MPSLNITTTKLRYAASDQTALQKVAALLEAIAKYDEAIKQDATTALNAVNHVLEHVSKERG